MGKNALSALKLGQARGVILQTAQKLGIPQFDYSPNEIKKAVSGLGHASKNPSSIYGKTIILSQRDP